MKISNSEIAFGSLFSASLVSLGIAHGRGSHYLQPYETCGQWSKQYGAIPFECKKIFENFHYYYYVSSISSITVLVSFAALAYLNLCKKKSPSQIAIKITDSRAVTPINRKITLQKLKLRATTQFFSK